MMKLHSRVRRYLFVIVAILFVFGAYGLWAYRSQYWHCIAFIFWHKATDAFSCGNYYFGVYNPARHDIRKADYYFGEAVELDSSMQDAWHQYARVAFLMGDYPTARQRINKQFEMHGDELMASYYIRGLIEGYAENYPAAEKDFKRFLQWSPYNWAAVNDLAWIYFAQGKYQESKDEIEKVLPRDPDNPWLLTMHAMSIYNLGDQKRAEEELIRAQDAAARLTEADWIRAYPGNDPRVAQTGLAAFRQTIGENLQRVRNPQLNP